jgi:hypothetical protein
MLAALGADELGILSAHLMSGWYKQPAVYGPLSELWWEIKDALYDIHLAHDALMDAYDAARAARSDAR